MKRFSLLSLFSLLFLLLLLCSCGDGECHHGSVEKSVVTPTCDKEGYVLHVCTDCGFAYKTDITPSTGHVLIQEITPPSCTSEGFSTFTCACGYSYVSDQVAPLAHNTVKAVTAPSCTSEGFTTYTCSCGYSYVADRVAPLSHKPVKVVTKPTCTDEGFTTYTCDCGYRYVSDRVAPLGHQNTETVIPATCTEGGYTQRICSVCSYSDQIDPTDALGHDFERNITPPTCSDLGFTESVCKVCEFSYRSNYIDPTGHTFTTAIDHPTTDDFGAFIYTCDCGYQAGKPLFYTDVFLGASVTENTEVLAKGIDVSVYQHKGGADGWLPLNWTAIQAAGFEFAILKAGSTPRGEGLGGKDATFEMDYADAKAAGVHLGAYFYTYATTPQQAKEDAELLIGWLDGKQFEYPIYFDLEDPTLVNLSKDELTELCVSFISVLQENGYYGALYSNNDWLINRLHGEALKELYDIWYARPPVLSEDPISSDTEYTWSESYGVQLGIWQYSHHGVIEGCEGVEFDFNYVYRDYPSIIKKYGYNGFPPEDTI